MSYKALLDFMCQWSKLSPIMEKYGDEVAPGIFFSSHKDENILGVFYFVAPDSKLIYSETAKDHAAMPESEELLKLPQDVMLIRGRVVRDGDKIVVMIYLAGDDRDPSQTVIANMLHQIVRKTGFMIDYIVDANGDSLLSEKVLEDLKECNK